MAYALLLFVLRLVLWHKDSCVGVYRNGRVEICANDQGNRITPSYVAWAQDGQRFIGDPAKNQVPASLLFGTR